MKSILARSRGSGEKETHPSPEDLLTSLASPSQEIKRETRKRERREKARTPGGSAEALHSL